MNSVVIVSGCRTPIGSFNGTLSTISPSNLGATVLRGALARAKIEPQDVSEVIMGQVFTAGQGQNPARQASMAAGIPEHVPAWSLNMVCGSGLKAVALAVQAIQLGDESTIVVAGGQESMSAAPHCANLRSGIKMGPASFVDTMVNDGLTDAFDHSHMGITAETIAKEYGISRTEQDRYSAQSQARALSASERFIEEIESVHVPQRKGAPLVVSKDEGPRPGTTTEGLSKLRPVFSKDASASVTAGNSSTINDGAAALVLMRESEAKRRNLVPLARFVSFAQAGVDPARMGLGPIPASKAALSKAGWEVGQLDLIEANEAFAVQALCVAKDMKWPEEKVNVNGGAIALGHPLGASGARVLVTLLYEMKRRGLKKGLATLCIGGGMGVAMVVEND